MMTILVEEKGRRFIASPASFLHEVCVFRLQEVTFASVLTGTACVFLCRGG
jgi:hypothetical protein